MIEPSRWPGKTFAEKVLARASGNAAVIVGQIVDATPDVTFSHDNTAAISRIFRSLGLEKMVYPERHAITLDHAAPAPSTQHATNHAETRRFAAAQGIANLFDVGRGICHQVISEEAIVSPGDLVIGSDSHTPHFGWLGACGVGVGRSEMAAVWATGELWLRVPESVRVVVDGVLPFGVTAKDLAITIIGRFGADGGIYRSIEFSGSTIDALSIDSRCVLRNMMAEFGAKNAYIAPSDAVFSWLAERAERKSPRNDAAQRPLPERIARRVERLKEWAVLPDANAGYLAEYRISAADLEPMVACPHTVDNVLPLSKVKGTPVQQAFIGTCTNGRLEDIAVAAEVVRGRRVARGTRLLVIPASSEVMLEAVAKGDVRTLLEAGAVFGTPGCGPCMGNHLGVPAPGETTISSANRNFRGRMGTRDASTYLSNPAVVAASAIAGAITDPRDL